MTIFGYLCVIVASVWIVYKTYVSYTSFGGTIMVSVYDAAIYPPFLAAFGLYWVLPGLGVNFAIWRYVVLAVSLAIVVAIAIRVAENLGDRRRY